MIKIWGQIKESKLPDIETERLYLRQRLISDADDIFAYARLPEVTWRWFSTCRKCGSRGILS